MSEQPTAALPDRPRTIVVPIDGSSVAQAALPVAHHLAAALRAEVQRITVRDGGPGATHPVEVELEGDATQAILAHVDALEAPLVVLSAHGHSGWTKRLAGSVAERVIRRCAAPVVVVGPHLDRSLPLLAPRALVVAVPPPPVPDRLLPVTADLARLLGASVVLVHVVSPKLAAAAEQAGADDPEHTPDLEALAEQVRAAGVARVEARRVVSKRRTRSIIEVADQLAPPVMIVAQAHAAEQARQSDQVTYKLLRHSRWPILATVGRPGAGSGVPEDTTVPADAEPDGPADADG